ncbi:MAG: FadR family transcriptional regulator [Longilinea sp.]|nr:FadR family transcriptional regulator [Longilinea sp.]MCA1954464.1 FCD domain-containing protein [Anaerolinea sp.]
MTIEPSEFLQYLTHLKPENGDRLPSLAELSRTLGISIASLREQLEVARALGFVEVRPKTGIRRVPYAFEPAVLRSVQYAAAINENAFAAFADLRIHVETAYWYEAVSRLTADDQAELRELVRSALLKLDGSPAQIPHQEHRQLHLCIYRRLENPFVTGLLAAYWDLYEAIGLNVYTDLVYLRRVWQYHQRMVENICAGQLEDGYRTLLEHMHLITERTPTVRSYRFE